ncbi:helix-turn-helix domain-containing protein [Sphingobacterium sp. Ag1]|uniref:helix-turn-helix domain-containing protein n=1 Tax=Sphingobacterium sp. Ag1 TaxID=1643451 RepID=UPI000ABDFE13|nr:helix-turn-helix transcriptional regulator [Sphingobacterium sp. Ag1]
MIGTKLARLRKQKGLSQDEIAALLNVSQPAYHKWESGLSKPTNDNILKICEVFEIDVDELLHDETSTFTGNTISDSTVLNSSNSVISNINMYSPELMGQLLKNQEQITQILLTQNKLIETMMQNIHKS